MDGYKPKLRLDTKGNVNVWGWLGGSWFGWYPVGKIGSEKTRIWLEAHGYVTKVGR